MPYTLSPSSLSLLKECPRCFCHHFNKGIKRPEAVFPSLPGGMDRALKTHFDSFRAKGTLPPELAGLDGEVKLFGDLELLKVWKNSRRGLRWSDGAGNVLFGAVDDVLQKGNKIIVLDFKTRGYPLKDDTSTYYQDQLDIYSFLLRKNGFETEDYAYLLFYHPDRVNEDGSILFNSNLINMPVSAQTAENIFKRAIATLSKALPASSPECAWCRWVEERTEGE